MKRPRPLVRAAGGEKQQNGSNSDYRHLAARVNAADFDRLTARLVLERARAGTLDIGILEALLLAARLEA